MSGQQLEGLLYWFPAFVLSTTFHEAAHAWAAMRGGDPTAYRGGQVSLSPLPHIRREPIGMLILPLLTSMTQGWAIGWASAPFDPEWASRHPRRAALMAAAGPAANLFLAVMMFVAIKLGLATGVFEAPVGWHTWSELVVPAMAHGDSGLIAFAARALSIMLSLNVLLAIFNLIPLPPLDGAGVIDILLPPRMAGIMRRLGVVGSLLGLFLAWRVFPMLIRPIREVLEGLIRG
jgi:Zn-dependent protease